MAAGTGSSPTDRTLARSTSGGRPAAKPSERSRSVSRSSSRASPAQPGRRRRLLQRLRTAADLRSVGIVRRRQRRRQLAADARGDRPVPAQPIAPQEDPVIGCLFIRDARSSSPDEPADAPPDFAANIVQGKGYDLAESAYAGYFLDLVYRLDRNRRPRSTSASRGIVTAGLRRSAAGDHDALASKPSRPSFSTHTTTGAPSPAPRSAPCCRPPTSGRYRRAASTAWTTGSCSLGRPHPVRPGLPRR